MLTNTSKYAIRAVIYLALNQDDGHIGIKRISEELKMPSPFLSKILQILTRYKILSSTKGPNGGFTLGQPAENISLKRIVELIEGNDIFELCLIGLGTCEEHKNSGECTIHEDFEPIRKQFIKLFEKETVAGLVEKIKAKKNLIKL